MNALQAHSAVRGHRAPGNGWHGLAVLVCVLVALGAVMVAARATDAADAAARQAEAAHREVFNVAQQANRGHASLRRGIDRNAVDVEACHRKTSLLGAAIDAVSRTQPGRNRAPRFVEEAAGIERP